MPEAIHPDLELDDIQSGALFERPSPYVGRYLMLRITDRAEAGSSSAGCIDRLLVKGLRQQ